MPIVQTLIDCSACLLNACAKVNQTKGSECHSDARINVWLQDMEPVKAAAIKGTGHTNECFEED